MSKSLWLLGIVAFTTLGCGHVVTVSSKHYESDGIYSHTEVVAGKKLGLTCIPGFSYQIKYDSLGLAVNGDSKSVDLNDLSTENVEIVRQKYADAIVDGLSLAVSKQPPSWYKGQAPCVIRPNFYDAGMADPFDITLNQSDFPYDPTSVSGRALHNKIVKEITDHWQDITD